MKADLLGSDLTCRESPEVDRQPPGGGGVLSAASRAERGLIDERAHRLIIRLPARESPHQFEQGGAHRPVAEEIDYTKLDKKLEQLRDRPPPKKRKSAGDVLEPVREKLVRLHATGWSYEHLAAELNEAGLPVKVGTLRDYLGNGHGGKHSSSASTAASCAFIAAAASAAGCS